jgi:hypothetical protein
LSASRRSLPVNRVRAGDDAGSLPPRLQAAERTVSRRDPMRSSGRVQVHSAAIGRESDSPPNRPERPRRARVGRSAVRDLGRASPKIRAARLTTRQAEPHSSRRRRRFAPRSTDRSGRRRNPAWRRPRDARLYDLARVRRRRFPSAMAAAVQDMLGDHGPLFKRIPDRFRGSGRETAPVGRRGRACGGPEGCIPSARGFFGKQGAFRVRRDKARRRGVAVTTARRRNAGPACAGRAMWRKPTCAR